MGEAKIETAEGMASKRWRGHANPYEACLDAIRADREQIVRRLDGILTEPAEPAGVDARLERLLFEVDALRQTLAGSGR